MQPSPAADGAFAERHRPYVGHAPELERIARGLDESLGGRGRLFLLMGEPGVGKTRFCDEATATSPRRGVPVLWGRSWESGGAPAYWPWLEVLAGLGRLLDDQALEESLGEGATLVGGLVASIQRRLPRRAGPTAASPDADEARFRLWRAVAALARRAAADTGLVLIFDDLHAADRSSLMMLLALARELRSMRVLVLATCRDVEARLDPEAGELIGRIGREGETLQVSRLDRATVGDLLRQRVGAVEPAVEARIFDSTQGNPLFLEEMLRLLGDEGPGAITAGVVPAGVRDVIRQRLDRVRGDARALLDLAAVAGDEIHAPLLALASGRPPEWIDDTVAEAERAGVFAARGGRYRFSHALVREVLYVDLKPERRRNLHAAVGRALEALHAQEGDDPALPLMELAHHALEGPVDQIARAVELTERAAARAIELTAPEEAIALLERALAALAAAGNARALRARLLLALGETRIRAGQTSAGTSLCAQVATLARTLGDAALLARAALAYGRVFTYAESDPMLVSLLEESLTAHPPGDSPTRARLLARLGAALQPSLEPQEPTALAREAIATARRLGDPRVLLETLHDGLSALMDVVDPRERRPLNLEVEALALRLGDRERLLRTHARLAIDALALGDLTEADVRIDAFETLATTLRAPWMLWRAPLFRAVRATMHGRFAEAEREVARAQQVAGTSQTAELERAIIFFNEGFLRTAERHPEMLAHDARARGIRGGFSVKWHPLKSAQIAARVEDLPEARRQFALLPPALRPPKDNLAAIFVAAESLAQVEPIIVVEDLYHHLLPYADQFVMLGMSLLQWDGPVARLLALAKARLGHWDAARGHFEDALARATQLEVRPHLARIRYEYGRALMERDTAADREHARAQRGGARALASELGMTGLLRLATQRLERINQTPATSPSPPVVAPATRPSLAPVTMQLEGEYWTLTAAEGPPFRLKDSLGLHYLARLLAEPGREIHVLDLVATVAPPASGEENPTDTGDAGELLDQEARMNYQRRREDLREALTEAESFSDAVRAARVREELEFLAAELARAVGLGGRPRRAGNAAERARSAVQRRIKNALQRIGEASPELALVLGRTIRTGNFCEFRPDPTEESRRGR